MKKYKELSFFGDKNALDRFKQIASSFARGEWKYNESVNTGDYIDFTYLGKKAEPSDVLIFYGKETWRDGYVKVINIIPLNKNQLTIEEYNQVLDLFFEEVIFANKEELSDIKIIGPSSDEFNPLDCISEKALEKLVKFCDMANKTTGSSHPCDEERWFDFICQTVKDKQIFDYDTLLRFLMDKSFWGGKTDLTTSVIGRSPWNENQAEKLAREYDDYVRILEYFIENYSG